MWGSNVGPSFSRKQGAGEKVKGKIQGGFENNELNEND